MFLQNQPRMLKRAICLRHLTFCIVLNLETVIVVIVCQSTERIQKWIAMWSVWAFEGEMENPRKLFCIMSDCGRRSSSISAMPNWGLTIRTDSQNIRLLSLHFMWLLCFRSQMINIHNQWVRSFKTISVIHCKYIYINQLKAFLRLPKILFVLLLTPHMCDMRPSVTL